MKKFYGYVVFFVVAIVAGVLIGVKYSRDPLQQMLKENKILIDRVLAVCETTDGENGEIDLSNQIILDGDNWVDNYRSLLFDPSDQLKIDQAMLSKIKQQIYPIRSDYNELADKYNDILKKNSEFAKKIVDQWIEAFNILGASLNNDLNDYRRKKKAMAMMTIEFYLPTEDSPSFLKHKIKAENT